MNNLINSLSINSAIIDYNPPKINYPLITLSRDDFPISILGENGSGKSSLTLAISGVIPDYIHARLTNYNFNVICNNKEYNLSDNKNLFRLIPQNVSYGLLGFTPKDEINIVDSTNSDFKNKLCNLFEIDKLGNIPSSYLSDGEKKRLIICLTLISKVPLIISDEWTSHLDEIWIEKISEIFQTYFEDGGLHLSFISNREGCVTDNVIDINTTFHPSRNSNNDRTEHINNILQDFRCLIQRKKNTGNSLDISLKYGFQKKKKISISSKPGDLICFIGLNGSGKTTLLKKIWKKSNNLFSRFYYNNIRNQKLPKTIIVSSDPLYQILGPTVIDEIKRNLTNSSSIEFLLQFFKVIYNIVSETDVLSLSYGQRKLFSIMIALLHDSRVILIDEPFTGLDEINTKFVGELLQISVSAGNTIVFSTPTDPLFTSKLIRI